MAIKTVLADLSEAPESIQDQYQETKIGDKAVYVLDLDGIDDHPKVRGVVTANRENIRKRDEFKAKVTELEGRVSTLPEDFDADEWARLKGGDKGGESEALQAIKDQHARVLESLKTKHATELAERDGQIGSLNSSIEGAQIDQELTAALDAVGVNPDLKDGAKTILRGAVKIGKDDKGNRKAIVETDLGEQSVSDYVKDWSSSKGKAYLSKAEGPGPLGNDGRNRNPGSKSNFGGSRDERVSAISEKFPDLPRQ